MSVVLDRPAPTTPGHPEAQGARHAKRRDPLYDNIKWILIVLVVVGHVMSVLSSRSEVAQTAYVWIYSFHMPLFAAIAGMFARTPTTDPRRARSSIESLLVPYVIFATLYEIVKQVGEANPSAFDILTPYFAMWFLVSLFTWRMLTPYLLRLRYPLAFAVVLSLGIVALGGVSQDFALDKTIGFLPAYVLGLTVRPEHVRALRRHVHPFVGVAVLGLGVVAAWWYVRQGFIVDHLLWDRSLKDLGHLSSLEGVVSRSLVLVAALVMCAAVVVAAPARHLSWTHLGAASMYVYLLHGFFVKAFLWSGAGDAFASPLGVALAALLAVALATLLASRPVRRLARPLVEPRVDWLFRRDPAPAQAH